MKKKCCLFAFIGLMSQCEKICVWYVKSILKRVPNAQQTRPNKKKEETAIAISKAAASLTKHKTSRMLAITKTKREREDEFEDDQKQRRAQFDASESILLEAKKPLLLAFAIAVQHISLFRLRFQAMPDAPGTPTVSVIYGREKSVYPAMARKVQEPFLKGFFPHTLALDMSKWPLHDSDHLTWSSFQNDLCNALWKDAANLRKNAIAFSQELVEQVKIDMAPKLTCIDFVENLESADMYTLKETARALHCLTTMAAIDEIDLDAVENS